MAITDAHLEWVKRPQQARAQQTLERLLDAAEAIISAEGVESATVARVAQRAGSSVGAVYARFADKEALLRCVFERFTEQSVATAETALKAGRWRGVGVQDALETLLTFMQGVMGERQRLIAAMLMRAAADPSSSLIGLGQRLHETLTHLMLELLRERGERVTHPDPETAVRVAVWMVLTAMESRVLYGPDSIEKLSDAVVARELARMVTAHLGIERPARARRARPADR